MHLTFKFTHSTRTTIVLTHRELLYIMLYMISGLELTNFTRFSKEKLNFSGGLNVFVGASGTGKSHILKLLYANHQAIRRAEGEPEAPTTGHLESKVAQRLVGVFKPDALGRLSRRCHGHSCTQVTMHIRGKSHLHWDQVLFYGFSTRTQSAVSAARIPRTWLENRSIYLPTREMLSIYPNFTATSDRTGIPFEETWRDVAQALGAPLRKGPHRGGVKALMQPLEQALGGKIVLEQGRFYIRTKNGKVEAHLMSEGMRKLGMLAQLIANGSLAKGSVLFWDEPEAHLPPQLIELAAHTIMRLEQEGIQIFIATHSLYLLQQLYLLAPQEHLKQRYRYFALSNAPDDLPESSISTAFSPEGLGELAGIS